MKLNSIVLFFTLFCGNPFLGYSQLTVSGSGLFGNDTSPGQFYVLSSSASSFVADPGTHIYVKSISVPGCGTDNDFIIRIGNYWYMGDWGTCGGSPYQTLQAKYIYPSTSIDPPCTGLWEKQNYAPVSPLGTGVFSSVTIGGTTCFNTTPVSSSTIVCPNVINLPRLSYAQILSIPSPIIGMMTFDTDNLSVRIYDGISWKSMMPNFEPATFKASISKSVIKVTTSAFTLTNQYNHIIYTGPTGTMNIPPATSCSGREYIITNYGTGILTMSQSFTNSNSGTINIINTNTTTHLISDGASWWKVN